MARGPKVKLVYERDPSKADQWIYSIEIDQSSRAVAPPEALPNQTPDPDSLRTMMKRIIEGRNRNRKNNPQFRANGELVVTVGKTMAPNHFTVGGVKYIKNRVTGKYEPEKAPTTFKDTSPTYHDPRFVPVKFAEGIGKSTVISPKITVESKDDFLARLNKLNVELHRNRVRAGLASHGKGTAQNPASTAISANPDWHQYTIRKD